MAADIAAEVLICPSMEAQKLFRVLSTFADVILKITTGQTSVKAYAVLGASIAASIDL
jgi:hypothetical protein